MDTNFADWNNADAMATINHDFPFDFTTLNLKSSPFVSNDLSEERTFSSDDAPAVVDPPKVKEIIPLSASIVMDAFG